jgi:flagellar assembly protein FliH
MTSSSPDIRYNHSVLRGENAETVSSARFDVDLRSRAGLPDQVSAELRAEAHAAGYAAGWAQGRQEAEAAARAALAESAEEARRVAAADAARVQAALAALARAATTLERRAVPGAAEVEEAIVGAAFTLAEAVIRRELSVATEPGRDALQRAMALAPTGRPVVVRLHPADHATIGADGPIEVDGRAVTLIADPNLQPGDAMAESDATVIDGRLAEALTRVRDALGLGRAP